MNLLAFDTATSACSAALWRGDAGGEGCVVARAFVAMARGQSEALIPMIQAVLAESGTEFDALDRLAVTVGPGAFTGLRIGLAAARGLALAGGLPITGITTFEAIAHAVDPAARAGARLLVAIDAKRADIYAQLFDDALAPLSPPRSLLPEEVPALLARGEGEPVLLVGDGAARVAEIVPGLALADAPGWPDAAHVAVLAAGRPAPPADTLAAPAPLYLRPPLAVRPRHGGRLRP